MFNFSKREKKLIKLLITIFAFVIVYFFLVIPIMDYKNSVENKFEMNISKMKKLDSLYEKYRNIKQKKSRYLSLLKRSKGITTQIEEKARETNILGNKIYTRDHTSNVQGKYKKITTSVKFESVNITSLLNFIHKMENSDTLCKVSYLRINQALKERSTYDVLIKFDSFTSP